MLSKAILAFSEDEALARGGPSEDFIRICAKTTRTLALCCIFSGSDDPQHLGFQRPAGPYQKYEARLQINGLEQERKATTSASGGQGRGAREVQFERRFQYSQDRCIESARNRLSLRGRSPRRCGLGLTGKPVSDRGFPSPRQQGQAGLCPARSPLARRVVAPHGRGRKWRERPGFLPLLVRHGAGAGYSCLYSSFSPASGSLPPQ